MKNLTNLFAFIGLAAISTLSSCERSKEDVMPVQITNTLILHDDAYNTTQSVAVVLDVLANDSVGHNASLSFATPQHGTITQIAGTMQYTYHPDSAFTGSDSFHYTVCVNGHCQTATVTVQVGHHTTCHLVAVNDLETVQMNGHVVSTPIHNDSTCGVSHLTLTVTGGPNHGTYSVNTNNEITYTPAHNYSGTDQITYEICGNGQCSTATIQYNVTGNVSCAGSTPVAHSDSAHVITGQSIIDVLANDVLCHNVPVTVTILHQGQHGTGTIIIVGGVPKLQYSTQNHNHASDALQYEVTQVISGQTVSSHAWVNLQLN